MKAQLNVICPGRTFPPSLWSFVPPHTTQILAASESTQICGIIIGDNVKCFCQPCSFFSVCLYVLMMVSHFYVVAPNSALLSVTAVMTMELIKFRFLRVSTFWLCCALCHHRRGHFFLFLWAFKHTKPRSNLSLKNFSEHRLKIIRLVKRIFTM